MRTRPTLSLTVRHHPSLRSPWWLTLVLLAVGCRAPSNSYRQPAPEARSNADAGHAEHYLDAGSSSGDASATSTLSSVDARAPLQAADGAVVQVQPTLTWADASHRNTTSFDARPTREMDAGGLEPTYAGTECKVDACNYAESCIRRGWWTGCECDPKTLPICTFPRFRALGQSRTDRERTMYLISGDGQVVAGTHAFESVSETSIGVIWTLDHGLQPLEQDPAGPTIPSGINADGSVITGFVELAGDDTAEVAWYDGVLARVSPDAGLLLEGNHATRVPSDGTAATRYFEVFDATNDGRMLVGKTRRSENARTEAAFWTREDGVQFLDEYLVARGLTMSDWDLWHINAVSDDGKTMIGLGIGPDVGYRWYLQLEAPRP